MINLKHIRLRARGTVKRHYVLLTLLCALSIFIGTEFNNVLTNAQTWYEILRGRQVQIALEGIGSDCEAAKKIGAVVAERALQKGIEEVVFDRGGYIYHGRVQALAEGAREGGLKF